MGEDGEVRPEAAIRFERLLPGPAERIWQFLTDTGLVPDWYGNGFIECRPGGKLSLMDGHIRGIVTQCLPPFRLTHSWNVHEAGEAVSRFPESYLSIELTPRAAEVLLTLTHRPVPEPFQRQTAMGWHSFLDLLGAALRGEPAEPRESHMRRNAARYGVDLARLAR